MVQKWRCRFGRAGGLAPALVVVSTLLAISPVAAEAPYAGRPLAQVLRGLQEEGLTIVFTSALVRPEMRVLAEPQHHEPRRLVTEILAPHGLETREVAGVLVVVRREPEPGRPGSIIGRVVADGDGSGVPAALIRLLESGTETVVAEDGRFRLAPVEPGEYVIETVADGYLERRIEGVVVPAGGTRSLLIRLQPRPTFGEEILVRPSRLTLLREGSDSSFAMGREEIERMPHLGGDIFRAVSLLPGVTANDVTARFSVHGGRRDEVKIVLDGQELYDAFHLQDYDDALSVVAAQALGSASLSTGTYPVSRGDRMGGVLDLQTVDSPPGRHARLGLSVLNMLASSRGRFADDRGSWLVTARRGSLDLAAEAIGDESPRFGDVLGKAELDTDIGLLRVNLLAATDELEIDRTEEEGSERLENDYRSTYGWLTHELSPSPGLSVETIVSGAEFRHDRGSVTSEEEGSFELADEQNHEVLALQQTWSLASRGRHVPRWGWEWRRYDSRFDYALDLDPELIIVAPFSRPRTFQHRFAGALSSDHFGVWASDRVTLSERLTAELGLRYDRSSLTGDSDWSPRLNLAWTVGKRGVVRAAWGRYFQSQRPYELQVEDAETTLEAAELAEHSVVGYETLMAPNRLGLEALRVELFHREIDQPRPRYESLLEPLNFFPEVEPDRVRIASERDTARGIELLLRGSRGDRISWWLTYSYSRSRQRVGNETVPRSLDQPHAVNLVMDFQLPRRWSLGLAWRYHTGWPSTPVEARLLMVPEGATGAPELVPVFGPLNSERLPIYHRLDLRASRSWDLRRGRLSVFADVQNLYDRRNLAGFDAEVDEEEGVVLLEAEEWPGIFPSLGISWEF